jgi:4-hydroxy-tetrahydrodipicolinate reductase
VINGERVIELNFESHGGVGEEFDSVEIEGVPNVREVIHGGVNGDIGTAAILINSIPKVLKAAPGLITMLDIPIPHATP